MITQRCKEEIIDRVDCQDVLSDFLQLRKQGNDYVCQCPFHSERSASFHVNPRRNRWHCFGCGKDGDAIQFLIDSQGMSFSEALEWLARKYNVQIRYEKKEQSDSDREKSLKRESMLAAVAQIQEFFISQFNGADPEADNARLYAYERWGKEFCEEFGIGYAPKGSKALFDFVRSKAISVDLLKEIGIISHGEKGDYAFFRERLTIPVRNRWGKIIGFTARYTGSNPDIAKTSKYINSTNSDIFNKSEEVFGIDSAIKQARLNNRFIMVEGAPDVMRLQIVGLTEAVAPLGTALTEKHLDKLLRVTESLTFIPDSDPPKDGSANGAGVLAVMKNGALAVRRGFDVTVREIPRSESDDEHGVKNDPDTYITSKDVFAGLEEEPFIVWYARKKFAGASTQKLQLEALQEIAGLLVYIDKQIKRDDTIYRLSSIFGKPKQWREAVKDAGQKLRESEDQDTADFSQKEIQILRSLGIIVRNNMYYSPGKDGDLERWSNFILRPVVHVKDKNNSLRIFEMINQYGHSEPLEVSQKTFGSIQAFQVAVESLGAYLWFAKPEKLNKLKEYLYAVTETAENISVVGWHLREKFFAFANGIYANGSFFPVDETGIVRYANKSFYLPAFSKMYADDEGSFDFERMFEYQHGNTDTLNQFVTRICRVFGDGGKVAFAWLLACMFRDHIRARKLWFPMLNLFGIKGSGKTALATAIASFFAVYKKDPPKLGTTSIPAMSYMLCHARNAVVVLDEYSNLLPTRHIEFLKGLWGGVTNSKMNMSEGAQGIISTPVYSGVIFCGQHQPTIDTALFSRCVHLCYSRTTFTTQESREFNELKNAASKGNAHLAMEIMAHRDRFVANFDKTFDLTRSEVKERLGEELIEDRVLDNWVAILTAFRILETAIDVPFSYAELFEICVDGIRYQTNEINKSSETSDFWDALNSLHVGGKAIAGTHFIIKHLRRFKPHKDDKVITYDKSRPLLYLNWSAVKDLIYQRRNVNLMKMDVGALENYLRTSPFFIGFKQQRFVALNAAGVPDYEVVDGKKVMKVIRPYAYVFDYAALQAQTGIELETSQFTEAELKIDEDDIAPAPEQLELPF